MILLISTLSYVRITNQGLRECCSLSCTANIKNLYILQPRLEKLLTHCRLCLSPPRLPRSAFVSCCLTCTLAGPSFLVMERVPPTAHTPDLPVAALRLLHWRCIHKISLLWFLVTHGYSTATVESRNTLSFKAKPPLWTVRWADHSSIKG